MRTKRDFVYWRRCPNEFDGTDWYAFRLVDGELDLVGGVKQVSRSRWDTFTEGDQTFMARVRNPQNGLTRVENSF